MYAYTLTVTWGAVKVSPLSTHYCSDCNTTEIHSSVGITWSLARVTVKLKLIIL